MSHGQKPVSQSLFERFSPLVTGRLDLERDFRHPGNAHARQDRPPGRMPASGIPTRGGDRLSGFVFGNLMGRRLPASASVAGRLGLRSGPATESLFPLSPIFPFRLPPFPF